mmetsp:Transcript_26197/g.23057  ORF Transcript_26197/g.23057 Transcript_26197/m.23057 type:complete len:167 (-) Transcript_26197:468-968(-)
MAYGMLMMELARIDAGLATLIIVQLGLSMCTLELFASEEQKKKIYDDMVACRYLVGWGLTEAEIGSDASNLRTTAKKVEGGYRINGNKRWIGNADGHMIIVWAKDEDTKKIGAYMVPTNSAGCKVEIIKNKLALRPVHNGQIYFNNVFVPEENRLAKATDGFASVN